MRRLLLTLFLLFSLNAYAQDGDDDVIQSQLPQTETVKSSPDAAADIETPTDDGIPNAPDVIKAPNAASAANPPTPAPPPTYEQKKFAVLQTLDKLTARTDTMTVPVGQATAVGPLFVDIKTCQKTPPNELPESVSFMQIWEAKPKPKLKKKAESDAAEPSQWVFSGWMYASSPALSAMDHPVYDVWLKDCVNETAASAQK